MNDTPPPVRFENRMAVKTFIRNRIATLHLIESDILAFISRGNNVSGSEWIHSRHLFSRSKYFTPLCTLLQITPEEREGIRLAEARIP